ncbi:MAG TPA: response regulator transcription factor [Candidatus Sulfotelmatobacter sp.]|nr:response regulator transcription factor [Candidatus Sulfotelmatobacter sp.]
MKKIRCVLAQDHLLLRQGLRRLFDDEPDIEVVADAGNASEALQRVSEHHPEVVVADAELFRLTQGQVEALIAQSSPETRVVFLNQLANDERTTGETPSGESVEARRTSAEELAQIVRMQGAKSTGDECAEKQATDAEEESLPRKRSLTAREREVLKLLAEGETVRSAATTLGLSVKTVDAHKFNLMRKLGIHNKAELVMWAIEKRVVKMPSSF